MIIIAATPIGNLQDASERLKETLRNASIIAAEDTRMTTQLMRLLEIKTNAQLISLGEHNEAKRSKEIALLAKDQDIVVVSDAGMPTVSDPGYKLVQEAVQLGVQVTIVPGPSAPLAALAVSGLPTDRFVFEGFVPRANKERSQLIDHLKSEQRTTIMFESPKRLGETLNVFATELGEDRKVVVCRELTKMYEEVKRGTLKELANWALNGVKGEIVIVLAGAKPATFSEQEALALVTERVNGGERLKEATKQVASLSAISARQLYDLYINSQNLD